MTNDRIKEKGIQGEIKERERLLKDKLLLSIVKRQERDWKKDRKDRRRKTE